MWATYGAVGKMGVRFVVIGFVGLIVGVVLIPHTGVPLQVALGLSVLGWFLWIADPETPFDLGSNRDTLLKLRGHAEKSRAAGAPIREPNYETLSSWAPHKPCPWCPGGHVVQDTADRDRRMVVAKSWVVFHPQHTARKITKETHAVCATAGQVQAVVKRRGTLTRLAAGTVLPGSAFLWAIAFPKNTTEEVDLRNSQFALIDPDWSWSCAVDHDQVTKLQSVVAAVGKYAASNAGPAGHSPMVTARDDGSQQPQGPDNPVAVIERLAAMRDKGVLSEAEFDEAKRAQLNKLA